jgi:hypothetical protein
VAHAEAYKDPGTPDEQSRRTFMANAVIALGGVIGLRDRHPGGRVAAAGRRMRPPTQWSGLTPAEAAAFKKATDQPVKVTFTTSTRRERVLRRRPMKSSSSGP